VSGKPLPSQHGRMTTSHDIQSPVAVSDRKLKAWERLEDVVLAVSIAVVLGLALGVAALLPLELVVPPPR
jgi:hypothetical protein